MKKIEKMKKMNNFENLKNGKKDAKIYWTIWRRKEQYFYLFLFNEHFQKLSKKWNVWKYSKIGNSKQIIKACGIVRYIIISISEASSYLIFLLA